MRIYNTKITTLPTITSTYTSGVFQTEHMMGFVVQVNYTATGLVIIEDPLLEFSISVQSSTDYGIVRDKSTAQWSTIGTQTAAQTSGPLLINVADAYGPHYRVVISITIGQVDGGDIYVYAKGV